MAREKREVWAKRVERLADSGLTAKEFAAEIGVNVNTLSGWRWRLDSGGESRRRARCVPAFVEVVAGPGAGGGSAASMAAKQPLTATSADVAEPLELILRGGHRVRVPVHFDAAALRRLVDALEAR
jgi:hypothetical protein